MLRTCVAGIVAFAAFASFATAARADTTICKLAFSMRGYSKNFQQSNGRGTITCDNGQHTTVALLGRGANLARGAGAFTGGTATFSAVLDISTLMGSYELPPAAKTGDARPSGSAGAMSNGQATMTFPLAGPSSNMTKLFGRIGIIPHSLSY